jgi:hypothetical protein
MLGQVASGRKQSKALVTLVARQPVFLSFRLWATLLICCKDYESRACLYEPENLYKWCINSSLTSVFAGDADHKGGKKSFSSFSVSIWGWLCSLNTSLCRKIVIYSTLYMYEDQARPAVHYVRNKRINFKTKQQNQLKIII